MALEKGSDGRWLVDGQPIVIQTTRDKDGLMFQDANIDGEELTELINSHTFVEAQNQHGERVELSFDMSGESLIVKDEKELLEERRAIEAQQLNRQTGIKNEVIETLLRHHDEWLEMTRKNSNVLIGERMIVLDKHGRAFSQTMENGEPAIKLSLPDSNLIGVSMLTAEQANKVVAHLEQRWPDMAPYVAWDFQDFAKAECEKIQGLLTLIRNAAEASQLAVKEEGASRAPTKELIATSHSLRTEAKDQSSNMPYAILTIHNTSNEAFGDMGRAEEVARIIDEAAGKLYEQPPGLLHVGFPLRDINGNTVGKFETAATAPAGELNEGTVRLVLNTETAAFEEEIAGEISRLWQEVAQKVRDGQEDFLPVYDGNGMSVGYYAYQAPASLVRDGVIDMKQALAEGRVYWAEEGYSGIAEDEYRYAITGPDFNPGYHQGEGEIWLVNAKGEIANGYEDRAVVREVMIGELTKEQRVGLADVIEGRVTFEEHERRITGDDPELS